MTQKLKTLLIAVVLTIIGVVGVSDNASAATTKTAIPMNSNFAYGGTAYVYTSEDYLNVYATYEAAYNSYVYVKLTLQRYTDGAWHDISTKAGYAEYSFDTKKNLNVTFSNISNVLEKPHRIKVQIYDGYVTSDLMQTAYSQSWTR
ncbi:hypothetical protein [Anoxybacteroides tepidamans]|uniref:hypothetical protein n=1 Tax=Anoxybacteroides tepidamans TaxID=265948 RepID=UPI000485050F|nr:hypothetical protein [Anoxybacillus tepidamans]